MFYKKKEELKKLAEEKLRKEKERLMSLDEKELLIEILLHLENFQENLFGENSLAK